ncbi:MAG: monovalent cation:proton antiporter-2 (CPA2) family protein [Alphaproteobacteria bacterium]|nr:monovalent cation:proton antiporter-2 (CPA2) family protein [Alphaproteobacteria bacterium]
MGHDVHLMEIVILLSAAVLTVATFRVLRLSPVLGYLAAGAFIGPYGLQLIADVKTTAGIAEFGIIFLMFIIGLELSLDRLRSMRKHVFGFGGGQMLITAGLCAAFFIGFGGDQATAIVIGGGLALSSTAIVLQVIQEQGEKSSQVGRLSLAILILQDLAVIPLLVFVAMWGAEATDLSSALTETGIKALLCFAVIILAGKLLLRPMLRFIASLDNTELFTATALLVVIGVAWLTSSFGLSPALGAFMAGLLIAETEFKPQVESDIMPYKGLLLGLFFMTVGMSLNLDMLGEQFLNIIGLTIALMATKALIIMALCRIFGFTLSTAIHLGLLLSQGGEFAFALFTLAATNGMLSAEIAQVLLVVVTMSMAFTPLAAELGQRAAIALERMAVSRPQAMINETVDLSYHVIISGFGRVGHTVARLLEEEKIPYVAVDMDSFQVARERKNGVPVYYGDTTRMHVLSALGVARARALIITHNDTRVALQTISNLRETHPDLPIIARARNIEQVQKLEKAGANLAVAEMFETSLQLGGALLKSLGISEMEISRIIELFRAEDYALTRTAEKDATQAN